MARDRASSGVGVLSADRTLFVGTRIPDEIRRMVPHLTSMEKASFSKILQGKAQARVPVLYTYPYCLRIPKSPLGELLHGGEEGV